MKKKKTTRTKKKAVRKSPKKKTGKKTVPRKTVKKTVKRKPAPRSSSPVMPPEERREHPRQISRFRFLEITNSLGNTLIGMVVEESEGGFSCVFRGNQEYGNLLQLTSKWQVRFDSSVIRNAEIRWRKELGSQVCSCGFRFLPD